MLLNKFMNKKNILLVSLIGTIILGALLFIPSVDYCYSHNWCVQTTNLIESFSFIVLLFPVIFVLSAITYKMQNEVFVAWKNFAIWYVPLFALLSVVIQNQGHGGDFVSGWFDAVILLFSLGLFLLISLIIIIKKSLSSKKR